MTILSICLSPGLQRSVMIDALALGEVNRLTSVVVDVAGKGVNACRVLQRLGLDAVCLAQGGDNSADLLTPAAKEGLNLRLIPSSGALRTCTSIIEMSLASGRRVTELVEPTAPVDRACVVALDAAIDELLPTAEAMLIAGSMAPGFPVGYQTHLAQKARDCGVPVVIDLQGAPLRDAMTARPALVKINLAEFAAAFLDRSFLGGEHSGVLAEPQLAPALRDTVAAVSRDYATTFVLTRGPNSIVAAQQGELSEIAVQPLAASETLSTIGCGDTFLAGMVAKLLAANALHADQPIPAGALDSAVAFATLCAQSSARTLHPGGMEDTFRPSLQ